MTSQVQGSNNDNKALAAAGRRDSSNRMTLENINVPNTYDEEDVSLGDESSGKSLHSGSISNSHQETSVSGTSGLMTTTTTSSSEDGIDANRGLGAISFSRWAFLFLLLAAAGILAGVLYVILRREETEDFETQFALLADEFVSLSGYNVLKDFNLLEGLSLTVTSFVKEENHPLGYVTLPDVQDHFSAVKEATYALAIAFAPLVSVQDYQAWVSYAQENQRWIIDANDAPPGADMQPIPEMIYNPSGGALLAPVWQEAPPPPLNDTSSINRDLLSIEAYDIAKDFVVRTRKATFLDTQDHAEILGKAGYDDVPQTAIVYPVFNSFDSDSVVIGNLVAAIPWEAFLSGILVDGSPPIKIVISNSCNQAMTFLVEGRNAKFLGEGDIHDRQFEHMSVSGEFAEFANAKELLLDDDGSDHCEYFKAVYPTTEFKESYETSQPLFMALAVIGVFVFTAIAFLVFDILVTRRQNRLIRTARKQNAVISSMFPKNIRKKLMEQVEETNAGKAKLSTFGKQGLRTFLNDGKDVSTKGNGSGQNVPADKPIADLFPETTIMFADIAGFTSWSSTREPTQVFQLLETIYKEFDIIAKKRRVFKVETVGDCYVAVAGVPDPKKDHALICCKFAEDCLRIMATQTKMLETQLGPDTADLGLRIGLHSGPVVAGVLRGENSRFQLFGDSMNTASRMESTGVANRIQVSEQTAELLRKADKGHWLTEREDLVDVKGKGSMKTFFVKRETSKSDDGGLNSTLHSGDGRDSALDEHQQVVLNVEKRSRATDWAVSLLSRILKEMAAQRRVARVAPGKEHDMANLEAQKCKSAKSLLDEVAEVIQMGKTKVQVSDETIKKEKLSQTVLDELHDFVDTIASLYNDNPFHNFSHAVHVSQSVSKLLSRIVAPDLDEVGKSSLHDHTYGITTDPLTRFSVVIAALIHDLDHPGVPNAVLVNENAPVAKLYKGRSVAEQNSVDIFFDLLMEPHFHSLRRQIYTNQDEFNRFRQLIVNTVMATDIVDKELKTLRNNRWETAFQDDKCSQSVATNDAIQSANRKATIVIEHLIQASDVAHTMQHFMVYKKWNERFFHECMQAYDAGRTSTNPADTWYKGEIGFFDFYIIPLAKKLKECGVFGVSSDEYLLYAIENKREWEANGKQIVEGMIERYNASKMEKKM